MDVGKDVLVQVVASVAPPVTALKPWTQDSACIVIVDDHIGVGSWGSTTEPIILATDYPAVVSGWRTLLGIEL